MMTSPARSSATKQRRQLETPIIPSREPTTRREKQEATMKIPDDLHQFTTQNKRRKRARSPLSRNHPPLMRSGLPDENHLAGHGLEQAKCQSRKLMKSLQRRLQQEKRPPWFVVVGGGTDLTSLQVFTKTAINSTSNLQPMEAPPPATLRPLNRACPSGAKLDTDGLATRSGTLTLRPGPDIGLGYRGEHHRALGSVTSRRRAATAPLCRA